MKKEVVSDKQAIGIIILFMIGTSVVLVPGLEAKNDAWLAVLISMLISFPLVLIYARLLSIFPGMDIFDILQHVFGKVIGKAIALLYTGFVLHFGALVLRSFGNFMSTVGLTETPMIVPIVLYAALCAWGVKDGIELTGRWIELFMPLVALITILSVLLLIPKMNIDNLLPLLCCNAEPLFKSVFLLIVFPFTQAFIFLMIFNNLKTSKSPYKVYISSHFIGGGIQIMITLTIILVLGAEFALSSYFPAYMAASRINIGNFLQRIEILVSVLFLIGGFIKISMCLLAFCNGFAKLFGLKDYRFIVIPSAALMTNLSYFLHESVSDTYTWISEVWPYYSLPYQVVLPVIIFFAAEMKKRKAH